MAKLIALIKSISGGGGGGQGGGGVLAVHAKFGTLDKTWQEIYDALKNGYHVSIVDSTSPEEDPDDYMAGQTIILSAAHVEDDYSVNAYRGDFHPIFHATAADGYPTRE